jgi:hypothetical protein
MPWRFVGRAEQLDRIRVALKEGASGPILITGESGIGRTAVLSRALEYVDTARDSIITVRPAGAAPLAALRPHLSQLPVEVAGDTKFDSAVPAAVQALAERAAGRRLVVALDDAHLADHASLLALRMLCRRGAAVLLATRPTVIGGDRRLDPTDTLRHERGMQVLRLPPLSIDEVATVLTGVVKGPVHPATTEALHAVTGGRPRLLYDLVVDDGLAKSMAVRGGVWRLGDAPDLAPADASGRGVARVVDAAGRAWQELAVDRVDELCRLAAWYGALDRVAAEWANVLLLRGRAAEGLRFLDSIPPERVAQTPELVLVKALTLAFGLGRTKAVGDFLLGVTRRGAALKDRLLAYRAWILAATGNVGKAVEVMERVARSDRETAVFVHATRAGIMSALGRANEAVFHFRRALATAESCPGIPPWMPPYLTACLIDAMMLAGRLKEATAIAGGFHAGEPGSGWEVTVTLSALAAGNRPKTAVRERLRSA